MVTSPEYRRGGAQKLTDGNGAGSRPSRLQASVASSSRYRLGLSSHNRSSPLTLKTSTRRLAAPSPRMSGREVSMRMKNRAYEVLVATPEIPEIDM